MGEGKTAAASYFHLHTVDFYQRQLISSYGQQMHIWYLWKLCWNAEEHNAEWSSETRQGI